MTCFAQDFFVSLIYFIFLFIVSEDKKWMAWFAYGTCAVLASSVSFRGHRSRFCR
jgi:hypothetical protein